MLRRAIDNRITRALSRATMRSLMRRSFTRKLLNDRYLKLTYEQRIVFHRYFARMFRGVTSNLVDGTWRVRFGDKEVLMPITSDRAWQDWDTAVSIVGHDIGVKKTYAHLLASSKRPDIFVDIGANYGTHSLLFLTQDVKTITFEPNPTCHEYFRDVCTLNRVEYDLEPVALGAEEGEVEIKFPEKETWLGSVDPEVQSQLEQQHDLRAERVPLRKLDSYASRFNGGRMLIKIDTEGNEHRVVQGAVDTIDQCRPLIVFESNDPAGRQKLYDFFVGTDYQVASLPWTPCASNSSLSCEAFLARSDTNYIAAPIDCRKTWTAN